MKRKVRVTFAIQPEVEFTIEETYPELNIAPEYQDGKLTKLLVDVEVALADTNESAESTATCVMTPVIEILRYLTGRDLKATIVGTRQIEPLIAKMTCRASIGLRWAILRPPCPMPKESDLSALNNDDTMKQLTYFNRAIRGDDIADKIKNFYLVMEREEVNKTYRMANELRYTRHAVVHTKLDSDKNEKAERFLKDKIGANSIDYNDQNHIRFLKGMSVKFAKEAQRILSSKIH